MKLIEIKSAGKEYPAIGGRLTVLNNISLDINKGEYVWLKGRSGCGKTTLLNISSGLDYPTSGSVHILGRDTRKFTDGQAAVFRNEKAGFIFQIFHLLPVSVFDNVSLPLKKRRYGKNELTKKTMAAIERVGTAHLARENALSLSGGEQQRIVFARALVKEPDIIFADEPFSNLDEETASPLIELLHEMHVAGKTIFLVTHSYENRIRSTRAITIENGAVVEL